MIDITLQNFEAELIIASQQRPVLLDIWAPWCGPCRTLGPVLEKLETAYAGRFTLAKLNSDEVPEIATQLSQMFGVRSIPFCVMFAGGQPVDGFVGAIPEAQIREFLDKHVPAGEALEAVGLKSGALHAAELNLDAFGESLPDPSFHPLSRFPAVTRDFTFLLETGIPWGRVESLLLALGLPLLAQVRFVDAYEGKGIPQGRKAVTFSSNSRWMS